MPVAVRDGEPDRHAVRALDLGWLVQEQAGEGSQGLESDEHPIHLVGDFAGAVVLGVDAEVDGAAEDLPAQPKTEPEAQEATPIVCFGIRECDSRFRHPEDARRDAAQGRAEQNEPLGAEPVVGVQARGVGSVACRAENQRPFDSDLADDEAGEEARDYHEAECQCVGSIDQVGLFFAPGAERVHGAPYSRCEKITDSEDERVVKCRAVPFSLWNLSNVFNMIRGFEFRLL